MTCRQSYSCYAHGCRNPCCLVAKRLYQRQLRDGKPGKRQRRFVPGAAPDVIAAFKSKIQGES